MWTQGRYKKVVCNCSLEQLTGIIFCVMLTKALFNTLAFFLFVLGTELCADACSFSFPQLRDIMISVMLATVFLKFLNAAFPFVLGIACAQAYFSFTKSKKTRFVQDGIELGFPKMIQAFKAISLLRV